MMDLAKLHEPFPVDRISWRVGSTNSEKNKGMALAFIDARDVMERLDKVCGAGNWQATYPWSDGKKVVCSIGILCGDQWVWKSNGAGDTDNEADKGALSDAFKRAAVLWGIGRYLYDSPNWWEEIVQRGKSYAFTDNAMKSLNKKMVDWLLPTYQERFQQAYGKYRILMDSFIDAMISRDLTAAAEYWVQIPESEHTFLWLAKSSGGILDQEIKKLMHTTEFTVATWKAREARQ